MKRLLGIDTGTKKSGFVIFDSVKIYEKGILPNEELIKLIPILEWDICLVEFFNLYMVDLSANNPTKSGNKIMGTRFGLENLNTILWIGRIFQESYATDKPVHLLRRDTIKIHFFGHTRIPSAQADSGIRKALIERYGSKGTKKDKGVLHGCVSHIWSALSLCVYWLECENPKIVKI